ncbi:hypothetical protein Tco_0892000 [Tanacetum coccineum]|uniref:Uncharacterized protein n=1 Tax=Tanacetum coccineum TaxID=301880 RepID=A0ABQ5C7W3_9ASTR
MPNLYVILEKEGFQNLSLTYLGGLLVLIKTVSSSAKEKLLNHTGVESWFSSLKPSSNSFVTDERIVWISLEGLPQKVHAKEMEAWDLFIYNYSYESESSDDEEDVEDGRSQSGDKVTANNDVKRVSELSCIHNNNLLYDNNHNNIMSDINKVLSDDPFNLYDIVNKRKDSGDDLKYPPSFTPSVINVEEVNEKVKGATSNEVNEHVNSTLNNLEESVPKEKLSLNNSICSKRVYTGGSILQLMDELVKHGVVLGLKRLHGFLEVTVAQVLVSQTSQENGITVTKMSTPATAEEKTNKKNDVKARGLLLMALPNEHQLTFSQYLNAKSMFAAIEIRFGGFRRHVSDNTVYAFMVENLNGSNVLHQDLEQIHEDDLEAMDLKWQLFLLSVRAKKAPRSKDGQFRIKTTPREAREETNEDTSQGNVGYLMVEEVVVLKREVGCKQYEINMLKTEFEKVKQEKDVIDFKIKKFDKASKDLDQLLGSQITNKSKKVLGYSAVPPPHPLIYTRPNKLDLSYSGLVKFKEPEFKGYGPENSKQESNVVCENESDNSKENSDKSLVKEQVSHDKSIFVEGFGPNTNKSVSEVEPKKVRKNDGAPIIEDWVSNDKEQDESKPKPEKKTVIPTAAKIEFAKPENHEKPVKKKVRYAKMYRSQSTRGNQRNWNGQKSNQLGNDFVMWKWISKKRTKSKPKRQNRARERKDREKSKRQSQSQQKVKVKFNTEKWHWKKHQKPNPKT